MRPHCITSARRARTPGSARSLKRERPRQQRAQRSAIGVAGRRRAAAPRWSARPARPAPGGRRRTGVGRVAGHDTATARIRFAPAATAAATALRSAQTVRPYDAFSTLQPTWMRPRSSTHGGADAEPRVRRVGAQPDRARRRHQPLPLRRRDHVGSAATMATISRPSASAPAARGARDVLVAQRPGADARGRVGDQRQAQHGEAGVARRDHLVHRRHPDQPGAQRAQQAHLGGRLVGGAGHARVDRLAQRAPDRRGRRDRRDARAAPGRRRRSCRRSAGPAVRRWGPTAARRPSG